VNTDEEMVKTVMKCEIWGFYGSEDLNGTLLGCDAV
jgi:hypothetical protein